MTAYLWVAHQTEPGMSGERYVATSTDTPPAQIKPTRAVEDLVHDESVYSDWRLLGSVNGKAGRDAYGESMLTMSAPQSRGTQLGADEVAQLGWYTPVER